MSTIPEDFVQDFKEYCGTLGVDELYVEHVSVDIKSGVTAFCVPSCYLFPRTLGSSALCSPNPSP